MLDDDGHGREDIRIRAKVTKRGSDIEVDLTASDPQTTSFVNSSHANMQAAVAMAFAYLIDPDIPKNSGALRPLKVVAKQGTIVWADPGLPVTLCTSHPSNEIVEAIIKAMAASCPERVMGGWGRRFRIAIQGEDPRTGRGFIWHMFHARPGGGASIGGDGWSSIGEWHSVGGLKFGSVEVAEVRFPLHFGQHEFRPGSGGKGQHRGGLGVDLDLVVETAKPARGNTAGDGARHGACGMLGGEDGLPHDYRLISNGKAERILKTKEVGIVDLARRRAAGPLGRRRRLGRSGADAAPTRSAAIIEQGLVTRLGARRSERPSRSASTSAAPSPISSPSTSAAPPCSRNRPPRRRTSRSACWPVSTNWRAGSACRAARCSRRASASCTAPPSRPTRCSNARAPRSRCSPPKATATCWRCAKG